MSQRKDSVIIHEYINTILLCEYCWMQLPFSVDIIKHQREISGKSTAAHAAVLAPDHVKVYHYPDIPEYCNDKQVTSQQSHCHLIDFFVFIIDRVVDN